MNESTRPNGYQLLLVEPSAMVRGIVVSVARELQLAQVHQTGSLATAAQWLSQRRMDGIFLSLHDSDAALDLIARVRQKQVHGDPDVPVVAMVPHASESLVERLCHLQVQRLLPLPFRIREVIDAMYAIWPQARRP